MSAAMFLEVLMQDLKIPGIKDAPERMLKYAAALRALGAAYVAVSVAFKSHRLNKVAHPALWAAAMRGDAATVRHLLRHTHVPPDTRAVACGSHLVLAIASIRTADESMDMRLRDVLIVLSLAGWSCTAVRPASLENALHLLASQPSQSWVSHRIGFLLSLPGAARATLLSARDAKGALPEDRAPARTTDNRGADAAVLHRCRVFTKETPGVAVLPAARAKRAARGRGMPWPLEACMSVLGVLCNPMRSVWDWIEIAANARVQYVLTAPQGMPDDAAATGAPVCNSSLEDVD